MTNKFEHNAKTGEFTFQYLEKITNNFSEDHKVGSDGYGVVYKGILHNGEEIAIKKLYHMPGLGGTEFRNEVDNLMRVQHPNITRTVGYCYNVGHQRIKYDGEYIFALVEERVICFEYLQGESLDKHITDISYGLDWCTRFKIIKGVCEGLNYLHNGSHDPIYHLNLKPANILLDKSMTPKIGDFALSKLFLSAQSNNASQGIGTIGYMPPEYIDRHEITSKFDVFSLGVIIMRIIAGEESYSRDPQMSSQEFCEHVHENWAKRLQSTMSSHMSEQVQKCITIALRCVELDSEERPTIAEIVDELNNVDTAESSHTSQVAKHALNKYSNSESRGRIAFSTTNRPAVPLDIFSCSLLPMSTEDELLTDGVSYNYNGRPIPAAALKTLLKNPKVASESGATDADVDAGLVSGLVFVSERDNGLETLYIALRFVADSKVKVFALADIFGDADIFSGVRLEDSGCIGGGYRVGSRTVDHCLIFVSTKEPVQQRRNPWTVVYKTNLRTGKTERLTPQGMFDLSPAVSPSGKKVAVASFKWNRWDGQIEHLQTDICVMNVDREECGLGRTRVIMDGGWPSWGSDDIIFFHQGFDNPPYGMGETSWSVWQYKLSTKQYFRVTAHGLDAMTPAAISETKVAVSTIRKKPLVGSATQYRHIEIVDTSKFELPPVQITQMTRPESDHYNPFVLDGGARIGYHRCRSETDLVQHGGENVPSNWHCWLDSPVKDIGLFRVSAVFPAISKDGTKLAFVDNEFKAVWIADSRGLRIVYETSGTDSVFSPVWNQNLDRDTLYICVGTSFCVNKPLEIYSIHNVSGDAVKRQVRRLTHDGSNNAFPSSSPAGDKFVFRSTGGDMKDTNLYIMREEDGYVTRLTDGPWIDTHCQWSPNGDWIVFSSMRDKPIGPIIAPDFDYGLDPGYFSVYLVNACDPSVVIRVMSSRADIRGHISYPVFSPDGRSIAVMADLAAVSVEPISLPRYSHPVRTYSGIFVVDIDAENMTKNADIKGFYRMTHSRYGCGTPTWTSLFATPTHAQWNMLVKFDPPRGGESWHM